MIEHVEDDHLVPLVMEVMQGGFHGLGIVVEVADQNDQAAPLEPVGQAVQGRSQAGRPVGLDGLEMAHHLVEVTRRAAARPGR